nr:MAG TPA: DASH complex subunit Ask1 [Caudoviricetes sp.]
MAGCPRRDSPKFHYTTPSTILSREILHKLKKFLRPKFSVLHNGNDWKKFFQEMVNPHHFYYQLLEITAQCPKVLPIFPHLL